MLSRSNESSHNLRRRKRRNRFLSIIVSQASKTTVVGAVPQGATNQDSAARAVREMFTSIAPRYDLLNHVLSFNVDRVWWRRSARAFGYILKRPEARILDLCCGTGDMTFALHREADPGSPRILGADFSRAMLERAAAKTAAAAKNSHAKNGFANGYARDGATPGWIEADALNLPFPDKQFDLVTSAFGFRNLADYDAGLREILRVLRPAGECGILECSEPEGALGSFYSIYFKRVLPRVGTLISGVRGPYAYLPASVERFPRPAEMLTRMKRAGFAEALCESYTFGIARLYRGKR
jgi:demethylmenaquinone methyltransferase / 2-methoxy-6-polyprenyl-1,4-benzoquinol methylase